MIEITNLRQGALLNHNHGAETEKALTIPVEGISESGAPVTVNGVPAEMDGRRFSAEIPLTEKFNSVKAEVITPFGNFSQELTVVWDKKSFKRSNFYIDDHSFLFTDLAKDRPASAFDHFYLKGLKEINQKYGTKFTLNTFFKDDHDANGFTLREMPDCYKAEWQDNADWLRLAFHACSEFPDRPYQNTNAQKLADDYDLLQAEMERIAGAESIIPPVVIHWAMMRPECYQVLRERGVKALSGQFINPRTGIDDKADSAFVYDVGYFVNLDEARYLEQAGIYHDFKNKITLFRGNCTANLQTCEEIRNKLAKVADNKRDWLSFASHEQYSFPRYFNYLPDHFQRIETAIRIATENDYKPVFFAEGFLGNNAWD